MCIRDSAGTVVEEGECVLTVTQQSGKGRYDKIVAMIEESEQLKSTAENHAAHLADRLVPYTLAGSVLVYLLTRNVTRALSVLMVDFSCALKLSIDVYKRQELLELTLSAGFFEVLIDQRAVNKAVIPDLGPLFLPTPGIRIQG